MHLWIPVGVLLKDRLDWKMEWKTEWKHWQLSWISVCLQENSVIPFSVLLSGPVHLSNTSCRCVSKKTVSVSIPFSVLFTVPFSGPVCLLVIPIQWGWVKILASLDMGSENPVWSQWESNGEGRYKSAPAVNVIFPPVDK